MAERDWHLPSAYSGIDPGDPNIAVSLTDEREDYCIAIEIGGNRLTMHTRSAIDLQHKLGLAILDWVGKASRDAIDALEATD